MDAFLNILKIINNLLPTIGVILSAIISYFVANKKAKSEIEKVKLQFNREDRIDFENSYNLFLKGITEYISDNNMPARVEFLKGYSSFLSKAPAEFYPHLRKLDDLYHFYNQNELITVKNQIMELYSKYRKSSY